MKTGKGNNEMKIKNVKENKFKNIVKRDKNIRITCNYVFSCPTYTSKIKVQLDSSDAVILG